MTTFVLVLNIFPANEIDRGEIDEENLPPVFLGKNELLLL
jgi:hypothetical protein